MAARRPPADPATSLPPGAVLAPQPAKLTPQLPSLAAAAPLSDQWLWEIKFDGYRLLARIEGKKVQLVTRGGHDWSAKMPGLVEALVGLGLRSAWLDGEIVVMGADGTPDFGALQNAIEYPRNTSISYFLFDVPYLEGHDLRQVPLQARRQVLQRLLEARPQERLRFSASFDADAAAILESARRMGLEGVMAKRRDAPYESRRTETWLKLKARQRQEFVVAGFRDRSSGEPQVGSLLLGVYGGDGTLGYVGKVGTGWDAKTATALRTQLAGIEVAASPFAEATGEKDVHWVQPRLVAEVEFGDWTADQQIRHATFIALRDDKPAAAVQREVPVMPAGPTLAPSGGIMVEGIRITHPERVIDEASGVTKLELARYYAAVAGWMLPHLQARPCSLVRAPHGMEGELFYQKHLGEQHMEEVRELPAGLWPGYAPLLEVPTGKALVAAAQMNVIEFHTWNARVADIAHPDRVVFDLDPGEGVRWEQVQEAALLVHGLLTELGLHSWLKTSGGKGLHIVVPLTPRADGDAALAFTRTVVQHLAKVIPQRFVARTGAANRIGRIFVDYLRNRHAATTAAAYSARSRLGMGVSMPIAWDELPLVKGSAQWTVRNALEHLALRKADPWAGYPDCQQTLAAAWQALGGERVDAPSDD